MFEKNNVSIDRGVIKAYNKFFSTDYGYYLELSK